MFKKSSFIDLSGKTQVSIKDLIAVTPEITITDFSFAKTSNGDTAIVTYAENENNFFFAPTVLTTMLHTINDNADALEKFKTDGLRVTISETTNKKGNRTYFNFTPVDWPKSRLGRRAGVARFLNKG